MPDLCCSREESCWRIEFKTSSSDNRVIRSVVKFLAGRCGIRKISLEMRTSQFRDTSMRLSQKVLLHCTDADQDRTQCRFICRNALASACIQPIGERKVSKHHRLFLFTNPAILRPPASVDCKNFPESLPLFTAFEKSRIAVCMNCHFHYSPVRIRRSEGEFHAQMAVFSAFADIKQM